MKYHQLSIFGQPVHFKSIVYILSCIKSLKNPISIHVDITYWIKYTNWIKKNLPNENIPNTKKRQLHFRRFPKKMRTFVHPWQNENKSMIRVLCSHWNTAAHLKQPQIVISFNLRVSFHIISVAETLFIISCSHFVPGYLKKEKN